MKIETENEEVFGNVKSERKAFSIANSSKAFKILSSNIYKNKIRAIVRELSCNCLDAHKLNGNTRPFELTVPTWLSQQFVVRDFGPGLSDEDIMNLYTTYFASTKDQSNDFIGALGLGSKSPFSYTDIFTVKSYFDGKCTTYNASMINGEPSVTRVTETYSSEPTGLEITIPTKASDCNRWIEEVKYVLFPFPRDNHKVIGLNMVSSDYISTDYHKDGYCEYTSYSSSINAVYGNIVYPLDSCPGLDEHTHWIRSKNNKIYIKFELGELDIQPSREELSFDDVTIENVVKRISKFDKELREKDIQDVLDYESTHTDIQAYTWVIGKYSRGLSNILLREPKLAHIMTAGTDTNKRIEVFSKKYKNNKIDKMGNILGSNFKSYDSSGKPEKYINGYTPFEFTNSGNYCQYIFIDQDCSKTIPKIIKQATNFTSIIEVGSGNKIFLIAPNIKELDIYKDACAISEHIDVKCYSLAELHKLAEFPEKDKPDEKRPKSPNGTKYVKSDNGLYYTEEELFLTAKEIREYTGYYNAVFGEMVGAITDIDSATDKNSNLQNSDNLKRIGFPVEPTFPSSPDSYVRFRPSAWKYLTKDNITSVYDLVYKDVKESIKEIEVSGKNYYNKSKIVGAGATTINDKAIEYMLERLKSLKLKEMENYEDIDDIKIIDDISQNISGTRSLMDLYNDDIKIIEDILETVDENSVNVTELIKERFTFMYDVTKTYNTYTHDNLDNAKAIIDLM